MKSEKGAITLFVLIACLFFVIILSSIYISTLNKIQLQEIEIEQIQKNYSRDVVRIHEIYEELINKER